MSLDDVFVRLRDGMKRSTATLEVLTDEPGSYAIETREVLPNGKRRWFGAVQLKKNYVSVHLMPVYEQPALLDGLSPALRARMQGKSCFNFKKLDEPLFQELDALAARCVAAWTPSGA